MLFARFAPILFALAVAGSLAGKRVSPAGLGTMRTDNPTFVVLLDRRDRPRGRAHLLPRSAARADRAGTDRTPLLNAPRHRHIHNRDRRLHDPAGAGVPARSSPASARWPSRATPTGRRFTSNGKLVGSKIIGQTFASPVIGKNGKPEEEEEELVTEAGPALLPVAPVGDRRRRVQRGGEHVLKPRPQRQGHRGSRRRKHQGLPRTEQALRPEPHRRADPGGRGEHLRLQPRPGNLTGKRLDPGAPHRRQARARR